MPRKCFRKDEGNVMGLGRKALVTGGTKGIGLAIVLELLRQGYEHIYVSARNRIDERILNEDEIELIRSYTTFIKCDFTAEDLSCFDDINDIDSLILCAGFGKIGMFEDLSESEISRLIMCNALAPIRLLRRYYDKISGERDFYCAVLGSITGHLASPCFSVYSAAKASLRFAIEGINAELSIKNTANRILEAAPGKVDGTSFYGKISEPERLRPLAKEIISCMFERQTIFIPDYESVYKEVLEHYNESPNEFALESLEYKLNRIKNGDNIN